MRARVKRRALRRPAPKVRRCACNGGREGAKERLAGAAGGLMIGGARDPAEARAEARAARALAAPPVVHRKCAACAAEEEARRSPAAGVIAPGKAAAPAHKAAEAAVNSLGPGRPLSAPERGFFEPRLGADLSAVRLHEDAAADRAARAMDAQAFALGRDVAFARGERARGGASLMAHELAHAAEEAPEVRRRLWVRANQVELEESRGDFAGQTIGQAVQSYFDRICPDGGPRIERGGRVRMDEGYCDDPALITEEGCGCMCDLIESPNVWRIIMRDAPRTRGYPHTRLEDPSAGRTPGSGGTGGLIYTQSPNSPREYGAARVTGDIVAMENWEVLVHEMCGHARLANEGEHPEEETERVRHGHGAVVPEANRIRAGVSGASAPERGYLIQHPYCGESFYRERGSTDWRKGSFFEECVEQREAYLERMRRENPGMSEFQRDYDIEETIPMPPAARSGVGP